MTYEKPMVEVMNLDQAGFMTASLDLTSAATALSSSCGAYSGNGVNNFSCGNFGGFNADNPPYKGATVSIGDGMYVYEWKGNSNGHWKYCKNY